MKRYACIDGEAIDGVYSSIGCSNHKFLSRNRRLTTGEILDWIMSLGIEELWGYGLTYDINHWFADIPLEKLEYLKKNKWGVLYYGNYMLSHRYGHCLTVSERQEIKGKWKTIRSVKIWDVFNFTQCSFLSWLKAWHIGTRNQWRFIHDMKSKRATFKAEDSVWIGAYNKCELDLMQQGVTKLKAMVRDMNLKPVAWHSAGSLADAMFRRQGVMPHLGKQDIPKFIHDIARQAYFGGRFEITGIGRFEGPIYDYDIHSAYPSAMASLPSLQGARFEPIQMHHYSFDDRALLKIRWTTDHFYGFGSLPIRMADGSLRYPLTSGTEAGWYWSDEVKEAWEMGRVYIEEGYKLITCSEYKPFDYLRDLYDLRQRYAFARDDRESVVKLILNSSYGKLAQHTKGATWQSFVYAGLTTALVRAELLRKIRANYDDILAIATDGITTRAPLKNTTLSNRLGEWSCNIFNWIFILENGVYFWDENGKPQQHTRGVGKGALTYENVLNAWRNHERTVYSDEEDSFVGYKTAMLIGLSKWRTWIKRKRAYTFTMEPARCDLPRTGDTMLSRPYVTVHMDDKETLMMQRAHEIAAQRGLRFESYATSNDWDAEQPLER